MLASEVSTILGEVQDGLLTYRDDVDLKKKLAVWESFYNYDRPHGAHRGKTPYEALREKRR